MTTFSVRNDKITVFSDYLLIFISLIFSSNPCYFRFFLDIDVFSHYIYIDTRRGADGRSGIMPGEESPDTTGQGAP